MPGAFTERSRHFFNYHNSVFNIGNHADKEPTFKDFENTITVMVGQ
jgi:hypothetical protein